MQRSATVVIYGDESIVPKPKHNHIRAMYRIFAVIQRVALAVGIAVSVYSCNSSDKMSDSGLPVCAVTADLD